MMMRQAGEARKAKLDLLEKEEEEERGLFFRHSNHIANHTKKKEEFGSLDLFLPRWIQVVVVVRKVVGSSNFSVACLSLSRSLSLNLHTWEKNSVIIREDHHHPHRPHHLHHHQNPQPRPSWPFCEIPVQRPRPGQFPFHHLRDFHCSLCASSSS